jgi:hypothetical protein
MYRIYGVDGYPKPCAYFTNLEEAIEFAKANYDLSSVKNMKTGYIEWSNFLAL